MADLPKLRVEQPGMMTTVQDLGRFGHARFGVAPGGALDRAALILGNRLVGNSPGCAALEITLIGPRIAFTGECVVAITGGDLGATLNNTLARRWRPVRAAAGDTLSFDPSRAGVGARAYLCVAGGIEVDPVMGSRSTDLIGRFGGWNGRPLKAGDELPVGEPSAPLRELVAWSLRGDPPIDTASIRARVVLGPQADRFTDRGFNTFLGTEYTVSSKSNRQGVRLEGPAIEHRHGADLISEGITHGAIQVPGDGQPIVLLAGRQTVGGYVKIATVIGADLDRFAQLRPGDKVRFETVDLDLARAATLAYRARLGPEAIRMTGKPADPVPVPASTETEIHEEVPRLAGDWDPHGVVRVLEAIERFGISEFSLELPGVNVRINRNAKSISEGLGEGMTAPDAITVCAPVLGVLYRRSSPDGPLLAEEGEEVAEGQVICLIEVMKSYHDVVAPSAGRLREFLVDDGQFVEYGQALAQLELRASVLD